MDWVTYAFGLSSGVVLGLLVAYGLVVWSERG